MNRHVPAAPHEHGFAPVTSCIGTRPASWSKIPAVLSVLDTCDWVFWVDADTLITNMSTPLERLLPTGPAWNAAVVAVVAAAAATTTTTTAEGRDGKAAGAGLGLGLGGPDLILTADSTGACGTGDSADGSDHEIAGGA